MVDKRYRLEGSTRSGEIQSGLQAQIADPLWMMARQWQVGEFRGEDAASPILAHYDLKTAALTQFQSFKAKKFSPIDSGIPLEAYAEQQPFNDASDFWRSAEAGLHLLRLLSEVDDGQWRTRLRTDYALQLPDHHEPDTATWIRLLARRSCDGEQIYRARAALGNAFVQTGSHHASVFASWVEWYEDRLLSEPAYECWDSERMEYRFSVGAQTRNGMIALDASEYPGGHLDWFSFDKKPIKADMTPGFHTHDTKTVIPAPLRFAGMATQRWFEFEDGTVNFGDVSASAVDFARMITAAFATAFGDDWYVIPVRVAIGSLAQIGVLKVLDTFGEAHDVRSIASQDGPNRVWRFFELKGDSSDPLLFVPSVALGRLESKPLERVTLLRDETENLVWGIEHMYGGVLEQAVDRRKEWAVTADKGISIETESELWRYRLLNRVPPYWIPFLPVRMDESAQIRLRRGRMSEWSLLPADKVGIRGKILLPDPAGPLLLYEEEVPARGIEVSRSYQFARHVSGKSSVWLGRRKQPATRQIPISRQNDEIRHNTAEG